MVMPQRASRHADTVYNKNAPGQAGYAAVSSSGFSSNEERLVSESLLAQTAPSETIRGLRPAFLGPLFPPRFGYDRTPNGIDTVIQVDRRYPDSSAQFSGRSGGYTGSSSPSIGWW
jgi:hypothetical protein